MINGDAPALARGAGEESLDMSPAEGEGLTLLDCVLEGTPKCLSLWQRRRRCLPRPRMLLRTKQRRHSSSRIRGGRLRMKGNHSRSGRSHPSPSQLLLLLQLMLFPPNTARKRKPPRQTNTQRQRNAPLALALLVVGDERCCNLPFVSRCGAG